MQDLSPAFLFFKPFELLIKDQLNVGNAWMDRFSPWHTNETGKPGQWPRRQILLGVVGIHLKALPNQDQKGEEAV